MILSEYFDTGAPIVITAVEFNSEFSDTNLYKEQFLTPFSILVGGQMLPAQAMWRYITPVIEIEEHFYSSQTGNLQLKLLHRFQYIPCDQVRDEIVKNFSEMINSASSSLSAKGLCPDFGDSSAQFRAQRNLSNATYTTPKLKFYPCSLSDRTQCASHQELALATVAYPFLEKLLVSSNFTDPVSLFPDNKVFDLDVSINKKKEFEIRKNRIEDDTSIFRGPRVRTEFVTQIKLESDIKKRSEAQIHCDGARVAMGVFGGCQEYASFSYMPSSKISKIRRNYKKITTVLGELGGFIKLVTAIVFFLYSYYNARSVRHYLARSLYQPEEGSVGTSKSGKIYPRANGNKGPEVEVLEMEGKNQDLSKLLSSDEAIKECVKTRRSGMDMLSKLDFVEMLQELMFEDHDKVLLPLLILRLKEKQISRKKGKERAKKAENGQTRKKLFSRNSDQLQKKQDNGSIDQDKTPSINYNLECIDPTREQHHPHSPDQDEREEGSNLYQKAYNSLISSEPKTGIKKEIKRMMVQNLSQYFMSTNDRKIEATEAKHLANPLPKIDEEDNEKSSKQHKNLQEYGQSTERQLQFDREPQKSGFGVNQARKRFMGRKPRVRRGMRSWTNAVMKTNPELQKQRIRQFN